MLVTHHTRARLHKPLVFKFGLFSDLSELRAVRHLTAGGTAMARAGVPAPGGWSARSTPSRTRRSAAARGRGFCSDRARIGPWRGGADRKVLPALRRKGSG